MLLFGRLVKDHASAAHEWMVWVLTRCEGGQRRQKRFNEPEYRALVNHPDFLIFIKKRCEALYNN